MLQGNFAGMCSEKFLLVLMGAEQRVKRAQTWERGPPSAPSEINLTLLGLQFLYNDPGSKDHPTLIVDKWAQLL